MKKTIGALALAFAGCVAGPYDEGYEDEVGSNEEAMAEGPVLAEPDDGDDVGLIECDAYHDSSGCWVRCWSSSDRRYEEVCRANGSHTSCTAGSDDVHSSCTVLTS